MIRYVVSIALNLAAQSFQFGDPPPHFPDVSAQEQVETLQHRARRPADGVDQVELLHFGQGQAQRLEPLDEAQAFDLIGAVNAAAPGPSTHIRQKAQLFVVADGSGGEPGDLETSPMACRSSEIGVCQLTLTG
jgi:hypothetical protein